jgi:hypothetical protein
MINPLLPLTGTRMNKTVQKCLQALIDSLGLTIGLQMISSAQSKLDTSQPEELMPERAGKDPVTV